jgi:dihydrofolate reductase
LRTFADISVSLDGFVAGPAPSLEEPLGRGGEPLHEWAFRLAAWRRPHGLEGGEDGPEARWVAEIVERTGGYVMGRRMFSGGEGPWESDPNATGWWGDEPPFHAPVFVVTHHARPPLQLTGTTFTFVTDGVASALAHARDAAGERDVQVSGGADVIRQAIERGLVDELQLHTAPVVLGGGTALLDGVAPAALEIVETIATPQATHVRYRITKTHS